ncbi:hypothetical protein CVT24_011366 [Panaeolus cyanescens]|uniref:Uncharacterized protein n=1 Tax=Panaeolus cyanescens TaxID=181874 RepID=A0A409YGQ4_9AGAR|nr:hypothetical protein CVT24_011366 [Panaeolus cyanescens]
MAPKSSLKRQRTSIDSPQVDQERDAAAEDNDSRPGMSTHSTESTTDQQPKFTTKRQKLMFQQVQNMDEYRVSGLTGAEVYYLPSFITKEVAKEWYNGLLELECMWYTSCIKSF